MSDRHPLTVFGRLLECCVCHALVDLIELPEPRIDADTYQCGECLTIKALITQTSRDMSRYDPATEPIPY